MNLAKDTLLENRYRIIDKLTAGGMGAIYHGVDTKLSIPVAIKENFFRTPESIRQFEQEALILARLHHPNLPRVTDHFSYQEYQYLVMDFIDGRDLWEIVQAQEAPFEESDALDYIIQVTQAVSYMHNQEEPIIHRDIKPQNIKVTPKGRAVLVDFGIAKIAQGGSRTSTGARGITPGFSPPEQYSDLGTTHRSDIYALGATFYAVLTGQSPPDSIRLITAGSTFRVPEIYRANISKPVMQAIEHAMQLHQPNRPPSMAVWQAELEAAREQLLHTTPDQAEAPTMLNYDPPPPGELNATEPTQLHADYFDHAKDTGGGMSGWVALLVVLALISVGGGAYFMGREGSNNETIDSEAILATMAARVTAQAAGAEPDEDLRATLAALVVQVTQQAVQNQPLSEPETPTPLPELSTPSPSPSPTPTPTLTAPPEPLAGVTITPTVALIQPISVTSKILFEANWPGNWEIYTLALLSNGEIASEGPRPITEHPEVDEQATWSLDGTRIAFNTGRDGRYGLHIMRVADGTLQRLSEEPYRFPAWSPDGRYIAFSLYNRIDATTPDGSSGLALAQISGDSHPSWAPDSQRIIYETVDSVNNYDLFIVNLEGRLSRVTDTPTINERYPAWSPDGQKIAFVSDGESIGFDLYVMNVDGSNATRLTFSPSAENWDHQSPVWSPDGTQLLFVSGRAGNTNLYLINVDGSNERQLTDNPGEERYPDWVAN